jgi:hypothetical protein
MSPIEGGVFGGVADARVDPEDPTFCRTFPPDVLTFAPGERRPLALSVDVPLECIAGEAELALTFAAYDSGRDCPGIWYGETRPVKRRAEMLAPPPPH